MVLVFDSAEQAAACMEAGNCAALVPAKDLSANATEYLNDGR